jgi:hypothetical protein
LDNLEDEDNFMSHLACSVGLDGVNCFKNSTYSVIPVGTKILNLHESSRTKAKFILLNAIIPGPKKPSKFGAYFQPYFEEMKRSKDPEERGPNGFVLDLATTEQDHVMQCDTTEHLGVAATVNCTRCGVRAVPNPATRAGKYIVGYVSGAATSAFRKDNHFTRLASARVAQNLITESEFGIRGPSLFALALPDFDVCYGELIEFFHKLQIVVPSTFWKDHIFSIFHIVCPKGNLTLPSNRCHFPISMLSFLVDPVTIMFYDACHSIQCERREGEE